MANTRRGAILLVGEDITNDALILDAAKAMKPGGFFHALNSSKAISLLHENPEIRLVIVSQLAYANRAYWIGFIKNLFPHVKVVISCASDRESVNKADGSLPHLPTKQRVLKILNSVLASGL